MSAGRAALAFSLLLAFTSPALAQRHRGRDEPRFGSLEAGLGVAWIPSTDFGERRAEELRNPTTGNTPLVLFVTTSSVDAVPGFQARVGFYLARDLVAEAGLRYSRPVLRTQATQDFESAPDATLTETLTQYLFDGSLVVHVVRFSSTHVVPFLRGGVGQIRELHQGNELMQTGTEYHAGGGIKLWFGRVGVRGDVAMSSRTGGFDLKPQRRTGPTADGSLIFRF